MGKGEWAQLYGNKGLGNGVELQVSPIYILTSKLTLLAKDLGNPAE